MSPRLLHVRRKDVLDAALTRAGRFDRSIEVRRPDFQGRLEGIKVRLLSPPPGAKAWQLSNSHKQHPNSSLSWACWDA